MSESFALNHLLKRLEEDNERTFSPFPFYDFSNKTMDIESSMGKNKRNPISSATGRWQFLTGKYIDPDTGKEGQNSTHTAVTRLLNIYNRENKKAPTWVHKLKNTKAGEKLEEEVLKLSEAQERELFFANIGEGADDTDLARIYDPQIMLKVYSKDHHTNPSDRTIQRAISKFEPKDPTLAQTQPFIIEEPKEPETVEVDIPPEPPEVDTPRRAGLSEFETAFADARAQGKDVFTFKGKPYTTALREEVIQDTPTRYASTELPTTVAKEGGRVYRNYHDRKPRFI